MYNFIILKITSNPLLFIEIAVLIIMSLIVAFPLWIYELYQVEKNWMEAEKISTTSINGIIKI